ILGAANIPADRIGEQQTEMAKYKGQPVIICCENGNDSIRAGRMLKMQGFEKIFCIKGGLQAWRSANLPLARNTKSEKNPD
ncbi:MAG: rhodanese-like domain-containing protein, partial [Gammaproteobacteria bacterium]